MMFNLQIVLFVVDDERSVVIDRHGGQKGKHWGKREDMLCSFIGAGEAKVDNRNGSPTPGSAIDEESRCRSDFD